MQIQTWHPPLWLCTHAKYYVKSGLTNVLKNANKTKNMHLFSIRIANYLYVLGYLSGIHFYSTVPKFSTVYFLFSQIWNQHFTGCCLCQDTISTYKLYIC